MNKERDFDPGAWATSSEIESHVRLSAGEWIAAYKARPRLVEEHANFERATAEGGYGRRQIFELVQNGADAMISCPGRRIEVVLAPNALYCANEGVPVSKEGVDAILGAYLSVKRGSEIGRFGLGFKSVLGVTNKPEFYSRTGSFGFDSELSAQRIYEALPEIQDTPTPTLRLATPINPAAAAEGDPLLRELMSWADTVVKLPREPGSAGWLSSDIEEFPAEFLLFSPHVGALVLRDLESRATRTVEVAKDDENVVLKSGTEEQRWRIFHKEHTPSEAAKAQAGELAGRDVIPILWAFRLGGRLTRGRFWAFFPTEYETTLSGIVNAPWKLNEDRKSLLDGPFNRELLDEAARLVLENLQCLVDPADPGAVLDAMPARGREAPNWADDLITSLVYDKARDHPCIPDASHKLRRPDEINLHPEGVTPEALDAWFGYSRSPDDWCHPSVETTSRRSRVERLFTLKGRCAVPVKEWLEILVQDGSAEASAAAIRAGAHIVLAEEKCDREGVEQAKIVLDQHGDMVEPIPGTVFLARDERDLEGNLKVVHPKVVELPNVREAVADLGISEIDASSELEDLVVRSDERDFTAADWDHLWSLVREIHIDRAEELLRRDVKGTLNVRNLDGRYAGIDKVLLPGPVVPADGSRDASATIDTDFHAQELELIKRMGAVGSPSPGYGSKDAPWFQTYTDEARKAYVASLPDHSSMPASSYLRFSEESIPGPLKPIFNLSEEGRACFTHALLATQAGADPWHMSHTTRWDVYPTLEFPSPVDWVLLREGRLGTSLGYRPVSACVGPALAKWSSVFPVAQCSAKVAERLSLPSEMGELTPEQVSKALETAGTMDDDRLLGEFYSQICRAGHSPPGLLRCRVGQDRDSFPPQDVTVVSDAAEFTALTLAGRASLLVPASSDARLMAERWQLVPSGQAITTTVEADENGERTRIIDRYPSLAPHLKDGGADLLLVPCSSVRLEVLTSDGKYGEERDFVPPLEGCIYYRDTLPEDDVLGRVCHELNIQLTLEERDEALNYIRSLEKRDLVRRIRELGSPSEKLLELIGSEAIMRRLPTGLLRSVEERIGGTPSPAQLADLALSVYGVDTLHEFRSELQEAGLDPPPSWAGSRHAKAFVKTLGFAAEFAGFESRRRAAIMHVEGPPDLPPLHAFQQESAARIQELLQAESERRGVLSLPTGAGKTRVCAEAITKFVERGHVLSGPILWIAQSDELCEQAVQSWSEIWRSFGPRHRLRISRLWSSNETTQFTEGTHLVVATIQKLQGCIGAPEYDWLDDAACVVIDEAHGATETSYTKVLDWLGLGRGRDRCPLIGLTATPFRGGEDETMRLIRRFQGRRLDAIDAPVDKRYRTLQEMRVLAWVEPALLSGSDVSLSESELAELEKLNRLPASVTERLGQDTSRNDMLLKSITSLDRDWPVLLFGASVDHAQTMAALLRMEGLSAAAIWGQLESGARRYYIEEFKKGSIQVLTNFNVLTTGFDAPQVRAIYVARPTYSPALYQQMIGRGLRGPLNGGKDTCLIVNVEDNIINYGGALAFTQFEDLWKPGVAEETSP